ncbi:MAG: CBS domain-containing protein [Actinomycetota bacterium]
MTTPDPVIVTPSTPINEVVHRLIEHDISGVPMVDDGRMVGVLTRRYVLTALRPARRRHRRGHRSAPPQPALRPQAAPGHRHRHRRTGPPGRDVCYRGARLIEWLLPWPRKRLSGLRPQTRLAPLISAYRPWNRVTTACGFLSGVRRGLTRSIHATPPTQPGTRRKRTC